MAIEFRQVMKLEAAAVSAARSAVRDHLIGAGWTGGQCRQPLVEFDQGAEEIGEHPILAGQWPIHFYQLGHFLARRQVPQVDFGRRRGGSADRSGAAAPADDPDRRKVLYFCHYRYVPWKGAYGLGLIHLIGGIGKGCTSILRQLVDAGTLSNLPGGLKTRGMRVKGDSDPIMPGEWRDVDIPSGKIADCIFPLPYKEPSMVLLNLLQMLIAEGKSFASIAELELNSSSQNAPVGTMLALIERATEVISAVQARLPDGEELEATEYYAKLYEKMDLLEMDRSFTSRSVNEGFSGGEKKRNEILQLAMLAPKYAVLDETDSGLDIDALKVVANGVNAMRGPNIGILVITHYQRLLDYIVPDHVHVMVQGRIVRSGGKELALELEEKGYERYEAADLGEPALA
jgi:ABC-type dipeptide/oligopeptide/nickel transport system ATPase subunit